MANPAHVLIREEHSAFPLMRVYVWQLPVRVVHWVIVLSIAVLSFTGYYMLSIALPVISSPGSRIIMPRAIVTSGLIRKRR